MNNQIFQIAELLSDNCSEIMEEMYACIGDTGQYFAEHRQEYAAFENVDGSIEKEDYQVVQWIVLTECLVKNNIAGALDWKCELDDFCFVVGELAGMKKYKLPFEKEWFHEEDTIEEWCGILNQKWQPAQNCLAEIDMSNDSYIILPLKNADYEEVKKMVKAIGQSIFYRSHEEAEERSVPHTLNTFFKKYSNVLSVKMDGDGQADSCLLCTMNKGWLKGWDYCLCKKSESDCFRITLMPQEISIRQILDVSRYFRLTAVQVKKRLSAGKEIYVKTFLYHTLMTIKALDEMGIAYEVKPFIPQYSLSNECTNYFFVKKKFDSLYHELDNERDKEWSIN